MGGTFLWAGQMAAGSGIFMYSKRRVKNYDLPYNYNKRMGENPEDNRKFLAVDGCVWISAGTEE